MIFARLMFTIMQDKKKIANVAAAIIDLDKSYHEIAANGSSSSNE